MRISKLQKFAWAFFALALATTTVFAQGYGNRNRVNNNKTGVCLEQISDLTEQQKTKIQELEQKHQTEMAELRDNRRGTVDAIEKNEIRGEMLKKVKAHRNEVKQLLTASQQEQYETLQAQQSNYRGTQGRNQGKQFATNKRSGCRGNAGYGKGNRGGKGKGCRGHRSGNGYNGNGRGNGNYSSKS